MWRSLVLVVSNPFVPFVRCIATRVARPAVEFVALPVDGFRIRFLGIHARHVPMKKNIDVERTL